MVGPTESNGNIGVGRAWNMGVRLLLKEKLDYLVILSATMRFTDGLNDFVKHIEMNLNPWGLETQHGWHCIALTRKTFETVGLFDENFYPAYYEDSDYIRRMELLGIHNPMSATQRIPKVDIQAGFEGNAHGIRKSNINVNMGACLQYFIDKWGHEPRYDDQRYRDLLYKWPFNNPNNDIKYWPVNSIEELKERYKLNKYKIEVKIGEDTSLIHESIEIDVAKKAFEMAKDYGVLTLYKNGEILELRENKIPEPEKIEDPVANLEEEVKPE